MQANTGVKIAPPRDRNSIRKDVSVLRRRFHLKNTDFFDIVRFLEFILPMLDPSFYLDPVEDNALPGRYAETIPAQHCIVVKRSVYDAATRGVEWARMILAHEFGHYFYHDAASVAYARLAPGEQLNPDVDTECQANIFAAELLAPSDALKGLSPYAIHKQFGVSMAAAKTQLRHAMYDAKPRYSSSRTRHKRKKRPGRRPDR